MKRLTVLVEEYLRKYPALVSISSLKTALKLGYSYRTPYTNSKINSEVIYSVADIAGRSKLVPECAQLVYNDEGRLEEANSFESILVKETHQKIFQDDVFGKAQLSKNRNRWIYVAQCKEDKPKSYFNGGCGKSVYRHDLGETYDDVREVALFLWDKQLKKVFKISIDSILIPSSPSFANDEGSEIIFHAYKRQHFGFGLLHCFNRPVSIYQATVSIKAIENEKDKQSQEVKYSLQANIKQTIHDGNRTNIFASLSPFGDYLIYFSGTGITHTYYLDLVILKKNELLWQELHRVKELFVGFYNTLKTYTAVLKGRPVGYLQTIESGRQKIYLVDLPSGEVKDLYQTGPGESMAISKVLPNGDILGQFSSHNLKTFFYTLQGQTNFVQPSYQEHFILKQFKEPVHTFYLQAKDEDIAPGFEDRANKKPVVVMAHGGPHGSVDPCLTLFKYALLKMGYVLILPNFSGSIGEGSQKIKAALGRIGQVDAKEIISLLDKLLSENQRLDRSRVHVHGGSYGGYIGGILGSRYSSYFRSVVILNGVLSIPANLWFTDIPEWNIVETLGTDKLTSLKENNYVDMFRQSPISEPMKVPCLQFLGAKDRRVPYRQGLLFDALTKEHGSQITTYVYQNSAHSLADSVQTDIDIVLKTLQFLEGHPLEANDAGKQ